MIRLNNGWQFIWQWDDRFLTDSEVSCEEVRLPHNVGGILPVHCCTPEHYSTICGYRKILSVTDEMLCGRVFLQFDGAAHIAEVFANGTSLYTHKCGYTSFRVDITDSIHSGQNVISVRLDCTENPSIPPFGHVIDYLTYGGIYRDVWLDPRPSEGYIDDVFVYTNSDYSVHVDISTVGNADMLSAYVYDDSGNCCFSNEDCPPSFDISIPEAKLWSVEQPYLYRIIVNLGINGDQDKFESTCGIRTAEFRKDGFYLNGSRLFLRGLNRHQSYPYIGYAAPEHLQRLDAQILKNELSCNIVRTSHYPQSRYFIDECDRLVLLVFTEIPGWQHIGNKDWQDQAVINVREMVSQYRNHPSIILWGVRINESVDNDELYIRTNEAAHLLDPSRQTSGVRYLEKSSLLEDVYAFNDFSYNGITAGCKKKYKVTPDPDKGYLITESNGHMFPTKSYDDSSHRQEHALRHAKVLEAAMSSDGIAGSIQWCMFDYQTHKDFGSGDRICYHGVLDIFRNHKLAAAFYASQGDDQPVLEIGSTFDIGDYPAGVKGDIYAFTNADEIRLYKNDRYISTFKSDSTSPLRHSSILIDDLVGNQLEEIEGFSSGKASAVSKCLNTAGRYGFDRLPLKEKLRLLYTALRFHMKFEQGYELFGKYMGSWGDTTTTWKFDAVKDNIVIKSVVCSPSDTLRICAYASRTILSEGDVYDIALVRIRIIDDNSNTAHYAQLPVILSASGAVELACPELITAEGGMCGAIVRTCGISGKGELKISCSGMESCVVEFRVE